MPNRFHSLLFLLVFALAAQGREVAVRIYSNQSPQQMTLDSRVIRASDHPVLHVPGAWKARIPGQPALALSWPLDIREREGRLELLLRLQLEEYVAAVLAGESAGFRSPQSLAAMAVAA